MKTGKREEKKRKKFAKTIVVVCIVMVTLFGIATYALAYKAGIEADKTLGILVGFYGCELLALASRDMVAKRKEPEKQDIERDC